MIPCLPPDLSAKLENIFSLMLFNSLDKNIFSNKIIFQIAIKELIFLENEGITLSLPQYEQKIYFKLSLLIGDNLGMNQILGYVYSFNANCCCRFCYIHKKDMQNVYFEKDCKIRTRESYEQDLKDCDCKKKGF